MTITFVIFRLQNNIVNPILQDQKRRSVKTATPSKELISSDTLSPALVDPAHVLVEGVIKSPGLSAPAEKKKVEENHKRQFF